MRFRSLPGFATITALIGVLCATVQVTAGRNTVGLDGRIGGLDISKSIPQQLNYQGYLVDAIDSVAVTATLQMTFRLFDSESNGTELWSETHPAVGVTDGLFHVLLGSIVAFPADLFDGSPMWLQAEVGAEILSPRKPLVSVAYGMRAHEADHAIHADTAAFSQMAAVGLADSSAVAGNAYRLEGQALTDLDGRWVNEGQLSSITGDMITDGQIINADISAGATIDPSKISGIAWTGSNDGAGSGLDADLLDGQQASEFLSAANDYGRSGVAGSLYEGSTALSDKYLGKTAQAADADKLDGLDSSAFADSAHQHDDRYYTEAELNASGTINDPSNPVDWTKLKSVPSGFADGTDDVGAGGGISQILEGDGVDVTNPTGPTTTIAAEFGTGTTQVARGDHDHDVDYVNEGQASSITGSMITDGQITNADISAAAAIDPTKISGTAWTSGNDGAGSTLDADLLDGQEASAFMDTTMDFGRSGATSSLYEGTTALSDKYLGKTAQAADADKLDGLDSSAFADSAHQHDDRYYTETELNASGTINDPSNPVDWTKLKSVPAGFADGTDDVGAGGISQILEGDGIDVTNPTGPTTTIGAEFGTGTTQVARGDHKHDADYVNEGQASSITGSMITDGQITNADISAAAAIDPTKISGIAWTGSNDGAGSGLDADLLDGQDASVFMDTTQDYGRSGVAPNLYEGTTTLGDKYVTKDTLDHLDAADGDPINVVYVDNDGKVRIGTASPTAKLHVQGTFHVGATGAAYDVNFYGQNSGSRMFWDASKMALRAGGVTGAQWDDANVGAYSFATGYDTKASKSYSVAMGLNTTASGDYATALGRSTTASGQSSTAMGIGTSAGGDYSTAMGYYTTASGDSSTAMGVGTTAGGVNATAAGYYASAGGKRSIAMGDRVTANGIASTAIGNYVTAGATNSIVLGKGQSEALRLINNISNSFIVGFDSQEPTLYVDGSSVGVGTNSTAAKLDVQGTLNVGLDDTGYDVNFYGAESGSRLFWDESKMALRAGQATGTEWDDANVGNYSLAAGKNTTASGFYSSALGYGSIASGAYSTAMGQWATASGQWSTAIGYVNTASGKYSVAIGKYVTAGDSSIVIGSGISGSNRLVNNVENSLVVGFNDTTATLFVGGDSNYVGIGTTSPTEELYVVGDIYCTGKLTSDGGNDPPYVLYDKETREAIIERVSQEVPQDKLTGAVLFWNGEQLRFEVYLPERGEFRDLLGNLLAEASGLQIGLLDDTK